MRTWNWIQIRLICRSTSRHENHWLHNSVTDWRVWYGVQRASLWNRRSTRWDRSHATYSEENCGSKNEITFQVMGFGQLSDDPGETVTSWLRVHSRCAKIANDS